MVQISRKVVSAVPEPSLRRMPAYLAFSEGLLKKGQEFVSSTQIAAADKSSKQILVNAMKADMQSEAAVDALMRFSPSTGQGFAACTVLAQNAQLGQVLDTVGDQGDY